MRDDRLPIMRIFTALFFIETDYVTTLLNPYFLDFERGWILCSAALWNTFKPSCMAAKHRSVNFLLPAHSHPDDIAYGRIALLKGFQRRSTDHSTISHHRDLSQPETLSHALNYRDESFDIGGVTRPHLAANRSALDVQGHADNHLVKIGPVIFAVAAFKTDLAAQRLHRILLLVTGCIEPALDRRKTKLNPLPGDRMMPFLAAKLFQLLLELAPVGWRSQQGADHAEAEARPSLLGTSQSGKIRHPTFHFFCSPWWRCLAFSTAADAMPTGILCGSWNEPHIASSFQAEGVVIGLRNSSTANRS